MNICAVRTSVSYDGWAKPLPHEPKSEFAIKMVRAMIQGASLYPGHVGNYAECKHCNCVFAVEQE